MKTSLPSTLSRLPLFDALSSAQTVLLAGAGGGYDVFAGLPLYFALRALGKTVHLANLSFSTLYASNGTRHGEAVVEVTHETKGSLRYFPEQHLARWFHEQRGESVSVYGFERTGVRPLTSAYQNLINLLGGVDAVLLVDGGTDSLMRGDEPGLGTPEEDIASLAAVDALDSVAVKMLACIGFGVDTFHGVCHHYFLQAVAELIQAGAYRGTFSLMRDMPEAELYKQATEYVHQQMFNHPSIVSTSILSAVDGRFGNYHANYRTEGSELYINPLMSLYWCFDVDAVVRRNQYVEKVRDTEDYASLSVAIAAFWARNHEQYQPWRNLPV